VLASSNVYPDLTLVFGPPELEGEDDVLLNPHTVVEVLSPSSTGFDLGEKFAGYRSLLSVREALFVSQDVRHVVHSIRRLDGLWALRDYRDDDAVPLQLLSRPLPLSEIFRDVALIEP
jgi:Uma2 family endonuclease